ncbi:MAG: methyltransferase domain-containing protein [Gallionella sp.]|jgi:SAM-dependent methyltransferase
MALYGPRLDRLLSVLACPRCRGNLVFDAEGGACRSCAKHYPVRNSKIYFVSPPAHIEDNLDRIKYRLKGMFGKYYYRIGVDIIAPTYPFNFSGEIRRRIDPSQKIVVDIGSGASRIDPDIICMDLFDYENVDVVCDVTAIPFHDGAVDAFVSRSMLEHVPEPQQVVSEIKRCTMIGGYSMHLIPFMMPFHASPYDFQRYTHKGALQLFSGWECVAQFAPFGPVTLLMQSTIECLSAMLSFGSERVKTFLYLGFCLVLFPIKFLDAPFVRRPRLIGIAPSIFTVVRKLK